MNEPLVKVNTVYAQPHANPYLHAKFCIPGANFSKIRVLSRNWPQVLILRETGRNSTMHGKKVGQKLEVYSLVSSWLVQLKRGKINVSWGF